MTRPRQCILAGVGQASFLTLPESGTPYGESWYQGKLGAWVSGDGFRSFQIAEDLCVVVRGVVSLAPAESLEQRVKTLGLEYRNSGGLSCRDWEGGFTVYLLDGKEGVIFAYRSMVAPGFTYFTQTSHGCAVSSNAALLARSVDHDPELNERVLPTLFLHRFVPGTETLFRGIRRLLPGELLELRSSEAIVRRLDSLDRFRGEYSREPQEELETLMSAVVHDCAAQTSRCTTLLSGGVDSSYLHVHRLGLPGGKESPASFSVATSHSLGEQEKEYASTMAEACGHPHTFVDLRDPYAHLLMESIGETGEVPNHVQSVYFLPLADAMKQQGIGLGLCGQGADATLGLGLVYETMQARRWGKRLGPLTQTGAAFADKLGKPYLAHALRQSQVLGKEEDWDHPLNHAGRWTHEASAEQAFGRDAIGDAMKRRRDLLDSFAPGSNPWVRIFSMDLFGEVMDSASLWNTYFESRGSSLAMPFLDSRLLRFTYSTPLEDLYPPGEPKSILKGALARHLPRHLIDRPKLAFSQPIFEWLRPGGPLTHLLDGMGTYSFLPPEFPASLRPEPNWFLYSLLCFDLWHKIFIEKEDLLASAGEPA